jgi:hypothetical protein
VVSWSKRRRERDAVYPERREQVLVRSQGFCEALTEDCTGWAEQVHHLAGRSGPDPHRVDPVDWRAAGNNLLAVCGACHWQIHAYPAESRDSGLMRSRHTRRQDA